MIHFSVIIPTLQEEASIVRCIDAVRNIDPSVEIIVADGGSTDRTVELAERVGALVCQCPRGRGPQMNAGAALATGEVLVFLHADTFLPAGAFQQLSTIFSDSRVKVGVFGLTFDVKHWLLGSGLLEKLSPVCPAWLRFGDSSITIRPDFFQSLGGFPDQRLFEDLELLRQIARKTRIKRIPMAVTTSARRFIEKGVIRQVARNVYYTARYFAGTSPDVLARDYERSNRRLNRNLLLIMVRYPSIGKVKSRLAADLGNHTAADIYRMCAQHVFAAARGLPGSVEKCLYHAEPGDREPISAWAGPDFLLKAQPQGGLGWRLDNGFVEAFKQGINKVIIVASDVPDISTSVIEKAFAALALHDVVIGPSPDGGYYLIGLKRRQPQLFRNIEWSTSAVLDQTIKAAEKSGLSVFLLPPLQDIDTAKDWHEWQSAQKHKLKAIEAEYAQA